MLLRSLAKAAKPATLSCQQSHKFRLGRCKVLLSKLGLKRRPKVKLKRPLGGATLPQGAAVSACLERGHSRVTCASPEGRLKTPASKGHAQQGS